LAHIRDGFREIVAGWMLVDDWGDLTDRIERAAKWSEANGPLQPDEEATIRYMIECQIARGLERDGWPRDQIARLLRGD
jgi:hypothetical protein